MNNFTITFTDHIYSNQFFVYWEMFGFKTNSGFDLSNSKTM